MFLLKKFAFDEIFPPKQFAIDEMFYLIILVLIKWF